MRNNGKPVLAALRPPVLIWVNVEVPRKS